MQAAMASTDVWVVDYFQPDCPACVQIKPFMEQLAKEVYRTCPLYFACFVVSPGSCVGVYVCCRSVH